MTHLESFTRSSQLMKKAVVIFPEVYLKILVNVWIIRPAAWENVSVAYWLECDCPVSALHFSVIILQVLTFSGTFINARIAWNQVTLSWSLEKWLYRPSGWCLSVCLYGFINSEAACDHGFWWGSMALITTSPSLCNTASYNRKHFLYIINILSTVTSFTCPLF